MTHAKRKNSTGSKKASTGSPAVSSLIIFLVGVCVGGAATWWYKDNEAGHASALGEGIRNLYETVNQIATEKPAPPAVTPENPEPQRKPNYDFYHLLPKPEFEVLTVGGEKDSKGDDRNSDTLPKQGKTKAGEFYMLQAGSFVDFKDADQLKAKLALQGMEAHIQKSILKNKKSVFRVRLGPFIDYGKIKESTGRLNGMGIKPVKLKVSATGTQ